MSTSLDIISFKYFYILVWGSEYYKLAFIRSFRILYFYLPVEFHLVKVCLSSIEDIVIFFISSSNFAIKELID